MRQRDKAIIEDLHRFRCLTRNDIIDLHFKGLKQPVTCANTVLKRLRRDGYIEVNKERLPFIYFPSPTSIKKDSAKIPHFLKIADFYKSLLKFEEPEMFLVEPKYGKKGEYMEPDAFMIWKEGPFFVEIQQSVYSHKLMAEKVARYESYYLSDSWKHEPWQPEDEKIFPPVIMITDTRYQINSSLVKFIQVPNINYLLPPSKPVNHVNNKIEININSVKLVEA